MQSPHIRCNPDTIPHELRPYPHFVVWGLEPNGDDKPRKVPRDPKTGKPAKAGDPSTWGTYEQAVRAYNQGGYAGIGYEFHDNDPFCGGDIDHCRNPETGELTEDARRWIAQAGTYTEISQSGTGLKFIGKAKKTGDRCKCGDVEMYDSARFFALTGCHVEGTPATIEPRQSKFTALYDEWFPAKTPTATERPPRTAPLTSLPDSDLLKIAFSATNGAVTERLYRGDWDGYNSQSEADQSLCSRLAFYAGPDGQAQVEALFRQSGLYREKWDRDDYRNDTISKAFDKSQWYTAPRKVEPLPEPNGHEPLTEPTDDTAALAGLPVKILKMGLEPLREATQEQKESILRAMFNHADKTKKRHNLMLGDAYNNLDGSQATKAKRMRAMGYTKADIKKIKDCGWVAHRWPASRRRDDPHVTWNHLYELSDAVFKTVADQEHYLQIHATVFQIRAEKALRKGKTLTEAQQVNKLRDEILAQGLGGELIKAMQDLLHITKNRPDIGTKTADEEPAYPSEAELNSALATNYPASPVNTISRDANTGEDEPQHVAGLRGEPDDEETAEPSDASDVPISAREAAEAALHDNADAIALAEAQAARRELLNHEPARKLLNAVEAIRRYPDDPSPIQVGKLIENARILRERAYAEDDEITEWLADLRHEPARPPETRERPKACQNAQDSLFPCAA